MFNLAAINSKKLYTRYIPCQTRILRECPHGVMVKSDGLRNRSKRV